jgi:hypothetical protein
MTRRVFIAGGAVEQAAAILGVCACAIPVTSAWSRVPVLESNRGRFPDYIRYVAKSGGVSSAVTATGLQFRSHENRISIRFVRAKTLQCKPASRLRVKQTIRIWANYVALSMASRSMEQAKALYSQFPQMDDFVASRAGYLCGGGSVADGRSDTNERRVACRY